MASGSRAKKYLLSLNKKICTNSGCCAFLYRRGGTSERLLDSTHRADLPHSTCTVHVSRSPAERHSYMSEQGCCSSPFVFRVKSFFLVKEWNCTDWGKKKIHNETQKILVKPFPAETTYNRPEGQKTQYRGHNINSFWLSGGQLPARDK